VRQIEKNVNEGEDGEKVEGIKRGVLPYATIFLSPHLVILNF